ncbi:MAG TPA: ABC transporter permease subunit [Stellaceae bacterium]|nr:ABC transporter permease subunit [Stellaceae bacterium]
MSSVESPPRSAAPARLPLLHDERLRGIAFQIAVVALVAALFLYLGANVIDNLRRQGIATGFGFLRREASFAIGMALIPFSPADTYARALLVGFLNTLLVAALGILLATVLGFFIGIARLSRNWLVSRLALAYVEIMRNTPLLLQLFVWWDLLRIDAPQPRAAWQPLPHVYISNRGIYFPVPVYDPLYLWMVAAAACGIAGALLLRRWAKRRQALTGRPLPAGWLAAAAIVLPPVAVFLAGGAPHLLDLPQVTRFDFTGGESVTFEFAAMLLALGVYTAAFIGEIVRAGILAVRRGQVEAAEALGLRRGQTLRFVVLPQAIRVIVPPLTSEYLNLTKNSSLAVAIGFPDLFSVGGTIANQTGQVLDVTSILVAVYLSLSLLTSLAMNLYNRRTALVER